MGFDIEFFEQKVDHFDYLSDDTFQHRYFSNYDYWEPDRGVLLYVCTT